MSETFWLRASVAHRKTQYRIAKELADCRNLSLAALLKKAIGWEPDADAKFEDNFRAGRMGRKKCARLYLWMKDKHPEFAERLDAAVGVARLFDNTVKHPTHGYLGFHRRGHNLFSCSICNPGPSYTRGTQSAMNLEPM